MAETNIEFGAELRRRREAAGLSQLVLARRVPCDKSWISRLEKGTGTASPDLARRLDHLLGAVGGLMTFAHRKGQQSAFIGLPPASEHLVGRARELADIGTFVRDGSGPNVCVLTGTAGVGKTALAVRAGWDAADLFPDGCLYLDFGAHTPGATRLTYKDALRALLTALKVPGEEIPPGDAGLAGVYQNALRGRRVLLVLDNVGASDQIRALLPAERACRVLVTSRNRLNALDDAVVVQVGSLNDADAAALFRSAGGERTEGADAAADRVAKHCARLPLAITIAAARFRADPVWSVEDFATELADERARLELLDDGERSIEAAFAVSCNALEDAERQMFGLLVLHPARRIRVDGAAALAGVAPIRARRMLSRLADAHLVTYETTDGVVMHDLLRGFARERILPETGAGERSAATLRLLDHEVSLAESCGRLLDPRRHRASMVPDIPGDGFADRDTALDWIQSEWPVLVDLCHEAAAHGRHSQCWQLSFALRDYFFLAKLWDPWVSTHQVAVKCARAAGAEREMAIALNSLGIAHADRGDLAVAAEQYQQALKLFRTIGDEHGITSALSNLAWTSIYLGRPEQALQDLRIVRQAYQQFGNRRNAAITLRAIALAETELGVFHDAVEHALEARREFETLDLPLDVAMSVNCAAWAHFQAGDLEAAATDYETARELADRCGSRYEAARAATGLGNVLAVTGQIGEAAGQWTCADALHRSLEPSVLGEARIRSTLWLGDEAPGMPEGSRD
ncbi:ATP-binding protein [Actinomadura algeriensis]|uniref:Tetratricopeptide (TPR) repeat protein/transcriptional regulator with XRE-family HTH domain n=1 Tax=Actinomadura algeriensis TaxID=1679523 RepID=A0ABR9K3H3_9ACTN|nr:XRE family transcriptional regulator [Actinomadura algeriensis]MBE1537076.1 tetratricopeptide (TPR) repeat protein/transcriptional regulator with XRE-family HTH domain [Actinomadura algeriensis]